MMIRTSFKLFLTGTAVVLCGVAFLSSADAVQPARLTTLGASPVYLHSATQIAFPIAAATAPLTLGLPSSVMPPLPAPGQVCSTMTSGVDCSTFSANDNCSAQNGNGNQCSTFGPGVGSCSVFVANRACSVLPPSSAQMDSSECSTFDPGADEVRQCSALALFVANQRCSTKGQGDSRCSTFHNQGANDTAWCSVVNPQTTSRSFCSTKFNQPTIAKGCSTFTFNSYCSILQGGKGTCTTFGAAAPASCSANVQPSLCSVMPSGPPGNVCTQ